MCRVRGAAAGDLFCARVCICADQEWRRWARVLAPAVCWVCAGSSLGPAGVACLPRPVRACLCALCLCVCADMAECELRVCVLACCCQRQTAAIDAGTAISGGRPADLQALQHWQLFSPWGCMRACVRLCCMGAMRPACCVLHACGWGPSCELCGCRFACGLRALVFSVAPSFCQSVLVACRRRICRCWRSCAALLPSPKLPCCARPVRVAACCWRRRRRAP